MTEFLLALAATVFYGSLLEWIIHRQVMHRPFFTLAFRRHTLEHHAQRRAPGHYFATSEQERAYHLFETSYMPVVFLLNAPYYAFFGWLWGSGGGLGAFIGTAGYIVTYEVLHHAMHVTNRFPFATRPGFCS